MFKTIDDFCAANQHTIEALGALGTLLAVVVSLYLASRASRTRLRAWLAISVIMGTGAKTAPTYLTLSVTNIGTMPLSIPFSHFRWHLPFRKGVWLVNPLDSYPSSLIPQRKYPFKIGAKEAELIYLSDMDAFEAAVRVMWRGLSWFDRLRFRWLHARVRAEDGSTFRVSIDKSVRKRIREYIAKERAATVKTAQQPAQSPGGSS